MPFRRKYRPRTKRRPYRRRYRSKASAASAIQKAFRRRRNKRRVFNRMKSYAVKKFNRSPSEIVYKSFTIVAPNEVLLNSGTGVYLDSGIVCTNPLNSTFAQCIEIGMLLKSPSAPNGVVAFSTELQNQLELFRQVRLVHGSCTLLRYQDSLSDGNAATPLVLQSIGTNGTRPWITYLNSVVDTGAFKNVNNLVNLAVPPSTNLASFNQNEYLANSNSRFTQVSWDSKKSIKTKVIRPQLQSEWAQQTFGIFDNSAPPVAQFQLKTTQPWIDTNIVENCMKNNYLASNPNYQSIYALGRLPPISYFGQNFPNRVENVAGLPTSLQTPLFKVLLSITCAFRIPTTRN